MNYHKIIIVGENNLCRSFMGEVILRGILKKRGVLNVEIVSRGLIVLFSEPVAPKAAALLRQRGYMIEGLRSAQLTGEEVEAADLVLTITKEQAEKIRENYNTQTACMFLGTFIDMDEAIPVIDEGTEDAYKKCFTAIESMMEVAAERIIGELSQ